MEENITFPAPPNGVPQQQRQMYMGQAYTSDGRQIPAEVIPPNRDTASNRLGANFSGLVGNNVTVPIGPTEINTEKKKPKRKKSSNSTEIEKVTDGTVEKSDPSSTVEAVVYSDTYQATTNMAYKIIGQTDELLNEAKQDLDYIRSQRSMKGKYHYTNAILGSMSSLLGTKLAAIKEINSTIKATNDAEYRRFKDFAAANAMDDNKAVMDAYTAFVSAPVGAPEYHQPGTMNLTAGLNGIIRADYPADVQKNMDRGMADYLANLSPEEMLMVNDNGDLEEVILYDEASGAKQFKWINNKTGQFMDNIPPSSNITLNDFNIDTKTMTARNSNLNSIKRVISVNNGALNKF